MKKLVQIHRLPTEHKASFAKCIKDNVYAEKIGDLVLTGKDTTVYKSNDVWQYQHLHFTSDEEIVKGREIYYIDKFTNKVTSSGGAAYGEKQDVVIATTNKALMYLSNNKRVGYHLPQISQQFIEEYVKAGGIDEVYLDYETAYVKGHYSNNCAICKKEFHNTDKLGFVCQDCGLIIKLDKNNCVIIHPVEPKLYTKEEVLNHFFNHNKDLNKKYHLSFIQEFTNNWIEENLK